MSVFQYLQLQPVDPQEDGTVSELDEYQHDDVIDLSVESENAEIIQAWDSFGADIHESASAKK